LGCYARTGSALPTSRSDEASGTCWFEGRRGRDRRALGTSRWHRLASSTTLQSSKSRGGFFRDHDWSAARRLRLATSMVSVRRRWERRHVRSCRLGRWALLLGVIAACEGRSSEGHDGGVTPVGGQSGSGGIAGGAGYPSCCSENPCTSNERLHIGSYPADQNARLVTMGCACQAWCIGPPRFPSCDPGDERVMGPCPVEDGCYQRFEWATYVWCRRPSGAGGEGGAAGAAGAP
jgi:hypothetical protein